MQFRKQQLELDMEQWTGSKQEKEYVKAVHCHSAYLTSMQSTFCEMPDQMNHKLKSRLLGEILTTSDKQLIQLLAESEELKSLLKEEGENAGLKLNIQKTKITVSGPITSWQIDGEAMETVMTDFIFLGSKITADGTAAMKLKDACSLEEKLSPTQTAY